MKNAIILLICSVLFFVSGYSQHHIVLKTGNNTAFENIYLSEGVNVSLGYQYDFGKRYFIKTSININSLNKNPHHTLTDDKDIISHFYSPDDPIYSPRILMRNFSIKQSVGLTIYSISRFSLDGHLGLSFNRLLHLYTVARDGSIHVMTDEINADQYTVGVLSALRLRVQVFEWLSINASPEIEFLPFSKIGYQEKKLGFWGVRYGLSIDF